MRSGVVSLRCMQMYSNVKVLLEAVSHQVILAANGTISWPIGYVWKAQP